jgi:hypothetical protein
MGPIKRRNNRIMKSHEQPLRLLIRSENSTAPCAFSSRVRGERGREVAAEGWWDVD